MSTKDITDFLINFFKPTKGKIILFSIICLSVYILAFHIFQSYITSYRYPLPFAYAKPIGRPGGPVMLTVEYIKTNFIINGIIYYIVSCLTMEIYNLSKKD